MSLPSPDSPAPRRLPTRALGALSASVIAFPLVAGSAQAASIPYPKPSKPLPSALDVAPPYQPGTLCLTEDQPGPVAFAKLLNATYGAHVYGVLRKCDQEHGEGRALDWMLNAKNANDLALGNAVTRWLAMADSEGRSGANARRLGINYIIWNKRIWKAWAPDRGWQAYTGSSPHTDHIHLSFTWDGAVKTTSWWTGKAVTTYLTGPPGGSQPTSRDPKDYVNVTLRKGSRGIAVEVLQKAIGGLTVDGSFGPATEARVLAYQKSKGLTQNGIVDSRVWNALIGAPTSGSGTPAPSTSPLDKYAKVTLRLWSRGEAVSAMQKAIGGLTVDGSFGPKTLARVTAWQKSKGLTVDGVIDAKDWKVLAGGSSTGGSGSTAPVTTRPPSSAPTSTTPATELTAYKGSTLRLGSSGSAVRALQKALGGLSTDGRFGPATQARVVSFQRSATLSATGVVDRRTWDAIERAEHPLLRYWNTVLRRGAHGSSVVALQKALRITADGSFGPKTEAAVRAAQKSARLAQTGVVATLTWKAVEARMR
ncbi:peptidoglycan-binding protein [Arthrobacter sp. NEB 688]|uniref:peptidoglycan-binding domain-containing protein n=1 Tax=Arthrobacter sp. NEB 688 TaxID=904039 RepID=UPI001563BD97|nr:peptidoglycan-binding protein [Arthrobacter sp. NEB 688]QKE85529.1 hypothetical protein HL663_17420 [Arthrobacter sp. NEB 688]